MESPVPIGSAPGRRRGGYDANVGASKRIDHYQNTTPDGGTDDMDARFPVAFVYLAYLRRLAKYDALGSGRRHVVPGDFG
jgi:hypothetical protein